jgi:hypothetical protein
VTPPFENILLRSRRPLEFSEVTELLGYRRVAEADMIVVHDRNLGTFTALKHKEQHPGPIAPRDLPDSSEMTRIDVESDRRSTQRARMGKMRGIIS